MAIQLGGVVHAAGLLQLVRASQERLVAAREEERKRLRRDLHDGLGPALAGLTLQVDTLRNELGTDDAGLLLLRDGIQSTVLDVRRLVEGLRPPALDELGLADAVHQLTSRLGREAPVSATVHLDELPVLPAAVEVAAYRIAQEAVTNVVRHSSARTCTVELTACEGRLVVRVADDGVGGAAPRDGGIGLTSMRDRTEEIGGRSTSGPAQGWARRSSHACRSPARTGRDPRAGRGRPPALPRRTTRDLRTVDDVEVVDAVGDGEHSVRRAAELSPDVVLMDLNLPGMPGLEAIRRIRRAAPSCAVLVLTMVDDDDSVTASLQVGARGYLLKGAGQEEVLAAIRAVASGGAVFGAGAAERVLAGGRNRYAVDLTDRESQVLALIADGRSNTEIAAELGVSVKTVQNHVSRARQASGRDRTQAAFRARRL